MLPNCWVMLLKDRIRLFTSSPLFSTSSRTEKSPLATWAVASMRRVMGLRYFLPSQAERKRPMNTASTRAQAVESTCRGMPVRTTPRAWSSIRERPARKLLATRMQKE